jgi:hypothetical protein
MTAMLHYVCDRCGNFWNAYRSTECLVCHSQAVWEFEREQPAREHAARIFAAREGRDAPREGVRR